MTYRQLLEATERARQLHEHERGLDFQIMTYGQSWSADAMRIMQAARQEVRRQLDSEIGS